jgi:hypothetical protein
MVPTLPFPVTGPFGDEECRTSSALSVACPQGKLPARSLLLSIQVVFPPTASLDEVPADYQVMADRQALKGAHFRPLSSHFESPYPPNERTHAYNCHRICRTRRL